MNEPKIGDPAAEFIGEVAGNAIVTIVSEFGKRVVAYWTRETRTKLPANGRPTNSHLPPYAIVGIGRCGSHVSAELAGMLFVSKPGATQKVALKLGWIRNLFPGTTELKSNPPKPMMIVGDIDSNTFPDVSEYFSDGPGKLDEEVSYTTLDYRPLAYGGAGHVPAFGEFITRALLLLPPFDESKNSRPWAEARQYLLEVCSGSAQAPRLVFYLFSSGGGTGSGAAAELVRAQRVAMNLSSSPDPEIYLTGITILPRGLLQALNRRHLINAGRLIVQYLAEMNTILENESQYSSSQRFKYMYSSTDQKGRKLDVRPLDSLGIVSNEVMASLADLSYEKAESLANRYIAQQVFALAASQIRKEQVRETVAEASAAAQSNPKPTGSRETIKIGQVDFQSTRLDPHDLKTSLRGPFGIAYGVSSPEELCKSDEDDEKEIHQENFRQIDKLFLHAINLPALTKLHENDEKEFVTGLSILPTEDTKKYADLISSLEKRLTAKDAGAKKVLAADDFHPFAEIELFSKCPRVVFVINAPEDAKLLADFPHRICTLLSWLMPRLNEARFAVVRQSNDIVSLSLFMQASVVLVPEIQKSIRNFVKLAWEQRAAPRQDFNTKFDAVLSGKPPIDAEQIKTWLGETEQYGLNVDDFETGLHDLQSRWNLFAEENESDSKRLKELLSHHVKDCMMSYKEITAALRFLNYVHNLSIAPLA